MNDYLRGSDVLVGAYSKGYYVGGATGYSTGYFVGGDAGGRTLKKGMRGSDVRALQQALAKAGFDPGINGAYGAMTVEAVKTFQASKGLKIDGVAGPATLAALNLPTTGARPAGARPASAAGAAEGASAVAVPEGDAEGDRAPVAEESFLTKKVGPLSTYGWGMLALAAGLGIYFVMPSRAV